MRVAMIGMGEVGRTFFEALNHNGVGVSWVVEKRVTGSMRASCEKYKATLTEDIATVIDEVDMFLSCVDGETAKSIASMLMHNARKGQVLVDFSTASAQTKRECGLGLAQHEISYVDIAIMGAIALTGHKTKMLAAGVKPDAACQKGIALLQRGGLPISIIDDSQPGDAISLKLLRSIFTKGLEALTVECLATAEHLGVRQGLYDVLADVDNTPLAEFLEMLVQTHLVHAARRGKEVQRAHEQVESLGLSSLMLPAVEAVFSRTHALAQTQSSDLPNTDTALRALINICRESTKPTLHS